MQNKRGISEVVSYVLLIVIAISLSTLVFSFLYLYVPKEKPECKDGINLAVNKIKCVHNSTDNILNFTLENKGLFKVETAYIRIGLPGREFREDVPSTNPLFLFSITNSPDLDPNEESQNLSFILPNSYTTIGNYILEIQPAHFTDKRDVESLALCPSIEQQINCN